MGRKSRLDIPARYGNVKMETGLSTPAECMVRPALGLTRTPPNSATSPEVQPRDERLRDRTAGTARATRRRPRPTHHPRAADAAGTLLPRAGARRHHGLPGI